MAFNVVLLSLKTTQLSYTENRDPARLELINHTLRMKTFTKF